MRKYLLLTMAFLYNGYIHAQFALFDDATLMKRFDYEVKQMSQFFDRFNFSEPVMLTKDSTVSRKMNLVSLMNLKDTGITRNPRTTAFLDFVGNDSNRIRLRFGDSNWHAIVHCSFFYQGKTIQADVMLKTEGIAGNGYSWVIAAVLSDVLRFTDRQSRSSVFINPVNNEVGFTELTKALNSRKNIVSYTPFRYQPDMLSAFLLLVQNGDMKLKQIDAIDFWFYQVPGWAFAVRNFNRPDFNSGWLIAYLEKLEE